MLGIKRGTHKSTKFQGRNSIGQPVFIFLVYLTVSNVTITGLYIHMTTTDPQTHVANAGDTLALDCNFHADDYNLFESPIVWTKRQLDEENSINLMSNINQPFLQTNRFEVLLRSEPPRYYFSLHIQNISIADNGNYTCQIRGQNFATLAESFHRVFVKSPFEALHLHTDKNLPLTKQSEYEKRLSSSSSSQPLLTSPHHHQQPTQSEPHVFRFVENRPGRMGCFTLGGYYPVPTLKITLDQKDITDNFSSLVTSFLSGVTRGLKRMGGRTQLWSENFTLTADHDQSRLVCAAMVESFQVEKIESLVDVVYQPKINCKPTSAFLYERNVFIDCRIKSKPQYFHYYWLLNYTTPSIKSSSSPSSSSSSSSPSSSLSPPPSPFFSSPLHPSPSTSPTFTLTSGSQHDGFWTEVKDRIDGITEIQLYFSEVVQDRFRYYTIVVENIVGTTTKKVPLLQKHKKVPTEILSDASVNNNPNNNIPYTNQNSTSSSSSSSSQNSGRKSNDRKKLHSSSAVNNVVPLRGRSSSIVIITSVVMLWVT